MITQYKHLIKSSILVVIGVIYHILKYPEIKAPNLSEWYCLSIHIMLFLIIGYAMISVIKLINTIMDRTKNTLNQFIVSVVLLLIYIIIMNLLILLK